VMPVINGRGKAYFNRAFSVHKTGVKIGLFYEANMPGLMKGGFTTLA